MNVTMRFSSYEAVMENILEIPDESYVAVGYPYANIIYRVRHVMNNRSGHMTHAANFVRVFVRYQLEQAGQYTPKQLDRMSAPQELTA